MRLAIGIAALLALGLAAPAARAAKPKPPLCAPGLFVVEEAASPLVPGGAAVPDALTLGEDATLALASGCPAVAAKQKGSKRGTARELANARQAAGWRSRNAMASSSSGSSADSTR